jgi:hypothetical protein
MRYFVTSLLCIKLIILVAQVVYLFAHKCILPADHLAPIKSCLDAIAFKNYFHCLCIQVLL